MERTRVVNEYKSGGRTIFECELCGLSYDQLETAERCEQYCCQHAKPSPALIQKCLRKATTQVNVSIPHEVLITPKCERFLQKLDRYQTLYGKLATRRRRELTVHLLDIGKQVRHGTKTWVRQDMEDIASWKGLRPLMLMINAPDLEDQLNQAIRMEDEPSRIERLCNIQGMGPVLVSMVLMFTCPETCGFMDYHTCTALRELDFEFPRKHSNSRFTVPQLLTYLGIIRKLRECKEVSAMEITEALYAFDGMNTKIEVNLRS